jgi:Ca2+-binding RTX toxin-like protein
MVDVVFTSDFTTRYDIAVSNTRFIVDEGVSGRTGTSPSIHENTGMTDNTIVVRGALSSQNYGLDLYGTNTKAIVEKSGYIAGSNGIALVGDNQYVENRGIISSSNAGIFAFTACEVVNHGLIASNIGISVPADSKITNTGTILSLGYALIISNESTALFSKTSLITSDSTSVYLASAAGHETHVINHGVIAAAHSIAILALDGNDHVNNRGEIRGVVQLGAGNDIFDNRGGVFVFNVEGGAGDDTYVVDTSDVSIVEAASGGSDTVKSSVTLSLSSALLASDELESLVLLGSKNINGTGNALANSITGNAGNNVLKGLAGADTFVLKNGCGNDVVADFSVGEDVVDLARFKGITNEGDLLRNHTKFENGDWVIFAGKDEIRFDGVEKAELKDVDFQFDLP